MSRFPSCYAIANFTNSKKPLDDFERFQMFLEAGFSIIQIRAKESDQEELLEIAKKAISLRNSVHSRCDIIINDSVEVCLRSGADGVHLGQDDGSALEARERLGEDAIIGLSSHSIEQANLALRDTLDIETSALSYLALGPIFNSTTKRGHAASVGLEALAEVATNSHLPLVAIGGITEASAHDVYEAGASSIALIAELEKAAGNDKKNGVKRLRLLKETFESLHRAARTPCS